MTQYAACKITYRSFGTYVFWVISFFVVSIGLRLTHELLHVFYAVLTGGSAGSIEILQWILFYPVFAVEIYDGNPFLTLEGTLITTWLISLLIVIMTSYPFLRLFSDDCKAANLSGLLFGVRLGAIFEMFGQAIYAMPNFVFYLGDNTILGGDGTAMARLFELWGYPPDFQYIIAFFMLIGAFFTLYWSLKCDPEICSCAWGGAYP